VAAAPLSALLALELGSRFLFGTAAASYAVAAGLVVLAGRGRPRLHRGTGIRADLQETASGSS
jgi:hypothetical protein